MIDPISKILLMTSFPHPDIGAPEPKVFGISGIGILLELVFEVVDDATEAGGVAVVVRHDDRRVQALC